MTISINGSTDALIAAAANANELSYSEAAEKLILLGSRVAKRRK